ncbi:hypothetical protein [Nocardioides iriomotensis]|uniref:Uncharacterized protein n=1 Tax=Nocardioides iriomotensis TaxID=715784 RepID=A0A4Q5J7I5_9ACTN|nr:hypothetical protein [Nocardioides iriomotensis]RYU13681.1 hypothetical protein ETU37_05420 [Nocardioides iriomotensis]
MTQPRPAADTHLSAMGLSVVLRYAGAHARQAREAVERCWSDCLGDGLTSYPESVTLDVVLDPDVGTVGQAGARGAVAATGLDELLHVLSPRLTAALVEAHAGRLVMLHAAGLADPGTGRTVALVAPSGTGKTTASRLLGRTMRYLTDETVAVDAGGRVLPYPKPLSVLAEGGNGIKTQLAPSDEGLIVAGGRGPELTGIFLLDRDPSRTAPQVEPVTTVRALALLAPQISYLTRLDRPLATVASIVERAGGLVSVRYGEAAQLADVVSRHVGATP